jgi:hypothetical protein
MSEETRDAILGFWALLAAVAFLWACVRGCDRVYNPDTIRADADARCKMYPKACAP